MLLPLKSIDDIPLFSESGIFMKAEIEIDIIIFFSFLNYSKQ